MRVALRQLEAQRDTGARVHGAVRRREVLHHTELRLTVGTGRQTAVASVGWVLVYNNNIAWAGVQKGGVTSARSAVSLQLGLKTAGEGLSGSNVSTLLFS
jgi:hypothetical protein